MCVHVFCGWGGRICIYYVMCVYVSCSVCLFETETGTLNYALNSLYDEYILDANKNSATAAAVAQYIFVVLYPWPSTICALCNGHAFWTRESEGLCCIELTIKCKRQ